MAESIVVNKYKEPYDIYIGRGSKWGNPFSHKDNTKAIYKTNTKEESIEKYKEWIQTQPQLMSSLHELEGKKLGCFCKPKECHGDVLVELIKEKQMIDIMEKPHVEIWTDGSSSNNKTRCTGWACILKYKDHYREYWGGFEPDTTNQQVEVYSALFALQKINTTNIPIHLHSDSAYLINCMNEDWINEKWRVNGWKNSTKKKVSNRELWEELDEVAQNQKYLFWCKVKGHDGIDLNERADDLAVKGRHDIEVRLGLRESKEEDKCTCKDCRKVEVENEGIFSKWII